MPVANQFSVERKGAPSARNALRTVAGRFYLRHKELTHLNAQTCFVAATPAAESNCCTRKARCGMWATLPEPPDRLLWPMTIGRSVTAAPTNGGTAKAVMTAAAPRGQTSQCSCRDVADSWLCVLTKSAKQSPLARGSQGCPLPSSARIRVAQTVMQP